MKSRLDHIANWKERAAHSHFKVSALAIACGTTDRQLRRYFLWKFGCSPGLWLTAERLAAARRLLCQAKLVKEVAAELWFKQASNLSRQFKKHYKQSPSSFRQLDRSA
jgi:transcriptional regulator GlxA family with amidase domain